MASTHSDCLRAREGFLSAIDDPVIGREVLVHCAQCAPCMAAFTELRETVDKLTAAADAVPPSETFATSIFSAIREKKRLRRRRRFLIAAIGVS